jgi:hypothetical protein
VATNSSPSADPKKAMRLAGLGTAIVGAALLLGAFFSYRRDVAREEALVAAQGTVIEQRDRAYDGKRRVVVTVRFTTAGGDAVRFEKDYAADATSRPAKGDTVTVLYDPARPGKAEIQDPSRLGLALLAALGGGFFLFGVAMLRWTFQQRRLIAGGRPPGGSGSRRRR